MTIPTVAKIGTGATVAIGTPTSLYFTWDHITLYEVERKVIAEEVSFSVGEKTTKNETDSWTIKISANSGNEWGTGEDKYSWECNVSGKTTLSIDKTDLEVRLSKVSGNTHEIRRNLVKACAKKRVNNNNSNKKVTSEFKFPETANSQNWSEYLFEPDTLSETEKKVLEDSIYFTTAEKTPSTSLTITATATTTSNTTWTSGGYSWVCEISYSSTDTTINKTALDGKIPTDANGSQDATKKANKKKLVYACSKDRKVEGKTVTAELSLKDKASQWESYLFGTNAA